MVNGTRRPIVAGNWKMNTTVEEAGQLATRVQTEVDRAGIRAVEVVLCPPFVALATVAAAVAGSTLTVGAQNCYPEDEGAYTGEISPAMLAPLCQYVIVGHSERRQGFAETDAFVQAKAAKAFEHRLVPIVCVGEDLGQYEAGTGQDVVTGQVRASLSGLSAEQVAGLVLAYEPIWAIGTGRAATPQDANEMIGTMRQAVASEWGAATASRVRIQYGGSVSASNAADLLAQPEIDGALAGGASLRAVEFGAIIRATERVLTG